MSFLGFSGIFPATKDINYAEPGIYGLHEKIINNKKKPRPRVNFVKQKDDKLMFFFMAP